MVQVDENGLKKTPLYDHYIKSGAKITDFGGWALPIQFTKIQTEHDGVRNSVGLFDASHMGEILVTGDDVTSWFNQIVTNDVAKVDDLQAQYTAVTKDDGGTLDDLIYYKTDNNRFMVTANASNSDKIYQWLVDHNNDKAVTIENQSDNFGLIAVQGPKADATLQTLTDANLADIKYYRFIPGQTVADVDDIVISRTGYTGETGFELYIPWDSTQNVWDALLEAGKEFDITECALGARDTLRLEAGLALYGNDITEDINPYEGGIGFAVKLDKDAVFPGKEVLATHRAKEVKRVSRGFELTGKGIARQHYKVFDKEDNEIGEVTSGTKSPTFGQSIGYMLVDKDSAPIGEEVIIEIRNKKVLAKVVKKDWLKR